MVVEFMLRGLKTEVDTDKFISLLKAGKDIENEYIIGVIQELVAKCKALEPLNISILDLLSIIDKQFKDIDRLEAELKQLKEENEKAKSNTYGIDWELFATGEIVVQCETEKDAEAFLEEANKRGFKTFLNKTTWQKYRENTCFNNGYYATISYCYKSFYESKGIKVVKWEPDVKEVLYDALESVQVEAKERINKLVKYCRDLRKENESLKNDKSELILAIKNTRHDIKMTADYLDSIVNAFHGNNKFDWDRFKIANIAVRCRTLDEAIDFIKSAKDHVKIWYDGDKIDYNNVLWDEYKEKTCYSFSRRSKWLFVTSSETAKCVNREILEWSDYMVGHDE